MCEFDLISLRLLRTTILCEVPDDGVLDKSLFVIDDHVAGVVVVLHESRWLRGLQFCHLLLLKQNLTLI